VPLKLNADHLQAMQSHAKQVYPEECCGLLLGFTEPEGNRLVEVRAAQNAWDKQIASEMAANPSITKVRRYWISPEEMLAAMRDARDRGMDIIGIYHSHPDHPALPSECDRQLAWPQYSYVILSIRQGEVGEIYSWQLDDHHQFQPEELMVLDP
jgi:proteasome lid subunit RPN8/RPN11